MRKKFTTYIEEESIAWLKQEALKQEIATGSKVSAADIINELIEKEKLMERKLSIYKADYGDLMLYNKDMSGSARRITLKEFIEAVEASTAWDDFDSGVYAEAMREVGLDFTAYDDPDEMWEDFKKAVEEAKK